MASSLALSLGVALIKALVVEEVAVLADPRERDDAPLHVGPGYRTGDIVLEGDEVIGGDNAAESNTGWIWIDMDGWMDG